MNSLSITPLPYNRAGLNHSVLSQLPGLGRGADRRRRRNPRHKNNLIPAMRKSENWPNESNQMKVSRGLISNAPSGSEADIPRDFCDTKGLSKQDNGEDKPTTPLSENFTDYAIYPSDPTESIYDRRTIWTTKTWVEYEHIPNLLMIMCNTRSVSNTFFGAGVGPSRASLHSSLW